MNERRVSLEVSRDAYSPTVRTRVAMGGAALLEPAIGKMDIRDNGRLVYLTSRPEKSIDPIKIRWPMFSANLNLVLTDRPILRGEKIKGGREIMGFRMKQDNPSAPIALVVRADVPLSEQIAAHEIGHGLGLNQNNTYQKSDHCPRRGCLMHERAGSQLCPRCTAYAGMHAGIITGADAGQPGFKRLLPR